MTLPNETEQSSEPPQCNIETRDTTVTLQPTNGSELTILTSTTNSETRGNSETSLLPSGIRSEDNQPIRRYSCCLKKGTIITFGVLVISIVVVVIVISQNKPDKGDSNYHNNPDPLTLKIDAPTDRGLVHTVDYRNSPCEEPYCRVCTQAITETYHYDQPIACNRSHSFKNGSCYMCGNECKTLEDLIRNNDTPMCRNGRPKPVLCCDLAAMGTQTNHCNGGKYVCLKSETRIPTCHDCPRGMTGPTCQTKAQMRSLKCRCFSTKEELCPILPPCDDDDDAAKECQTQISNDLRCVCNNTHHSDDHIPSCDVVKAGSLHNGACQPSKPHFLIGALVLCTVMIINRIFFREFT